MSEQFLDPFPETTEEKQVEASLRPQKLSDFIAQTKVKDRLKIFIKAAKQTLTSKAMTSTRTELLVFVMTTNLWFLINRSRPIRLALASRSAKEAVPTKRGLLQLLIPSLMSRKKSAPASHPVLGLVKKKRRSLLRLTAHVS